MASSKQPVSKTVYALKSPYSESLWPVISGKLETAILDLLIPLLVPVGQYRDRHSRLVKGKRRKGSKKRTDEKNDMVLVEVPQEPEIQKYLTVGFNSTVRHLEALPQRQILKEKLKDAPHVDVLQPLCAVLVCTSALPSVMTSPLPLLVATASLSLPDDTSVRLIPMSQIGSARIAESMQQPQVNVLGLLRGFAAAEEIQDLITAQVEAIDVPWLREAADDRYQPVKVHAIDIIAGDGKHKKRKRDEK